jgi:penicillin-binding protein 2
MIKRGRKLKEPSRESVSFQNRIAVATIGMLLLIMVLLGRLSFLQLLNHDHYTTLSLENRLKVVPIAPTRGLIYSRDGVLLAENHASFNLEVVPEQTQDLGRALAAIQPYVSLSAEQLARFATERKQHRRFDTITLKDNLTEEEVAVFSANRYRFPGFAIAGRLTRYYPLGAETGAVIGYVSRINQDELRRLDASEYSGTSHIGKEGIERAYETELHGKVGYQQVEVNAQGRVLRVLESTPPTAGQTLHLAIDTRLQRAAIKALEGQKGAIVAIEPASGNVVAFVSNPSFDPNPFVNGISVGLYDELRNAPERPLFNRALQGLYPPGSTVKPVMAAGGLEMGLRDRHSTTFCPSFFQLPGAEHKYRCWQKAGHGTIDLVSSIAESCDVFYYSLARDMGIDRMHDLLISFGLGTVTGIDLPGELPGLVPSREWKRRARKLPWFPGETLLNGIGQGFMLASPVQLAHTATVLANRGRVIAPHVVETFEEPISGERVAFAPVERAPVPIKREESWNAAIEGMHEVVQGERGTARASGQGAAYQYAGKTGTAQLFGIAQDKRINVKDITKQLRDHALFLSFAPMDAPKLALGIIVENGESGAHTAAPIARELFDFYFALPGADDASG